MIKKILYWFGGLILFSVFIAIVFPGSSQQVTPITDQSHEIIVETQKAVSNTASQYTHYAVTDIVDGDTIKINKGGSIETLRLIGLDTPETIDPRKPVQCFGKEASNKAKELLSGRKVRIEMDPSQGTLDKYGRTLAYVYRDDGLFYNKHMIEQGYAHEYTYNTPYKYQVEFKAAQKTAQANQAGLWSPSTCNGDTTSSSAPASSTTQTPPPASQTTTGDKDCKDFKTQAEAQTYFNSKGGSSTNNVDRLDGSDKDGKVCESLP